MIATTQMMLPTLGEVAQAVSGPTALTLFLVVLLMYFVWHFVPFTKQQLGKLISSVCKTLENTSDTLVKQNETLVEVSVVLKETSRDLKAIQLALTKVSDKLNELDHRVTRIETSVLLSASNKASKPKPFQPDSNV